ncbi:hypothetical protein ACJJTC_015678 [Scirpophaga incertulas]
MRGFVLFTLTVIVIAVACAFPQQVQPPAHPAVEVVKQVSDVDINSYQFEFETSDGTIRQEQGDYKNDTEQQGLSVKGSYKYVAPDGQQIQVSYVADKNGYQPTEHAGSTASQPQA